MTTYCELTTQTLQEHWRRPQQHFVHQVTTTAATFKGFSRCRWAISDRGEHPDQLPASRLSIWDLCWPPSRFHSPPATLTLPGVIPQIFSHIPASHRTDTVDHLLHHTTHPPLCRTQLAVAFTVPPLAFSSDRYLLRQSCPFAHVHVHIRVCCPHLHLAAHVLVHV